MSPEKLRAEWFWTDRWFSSSASFLPLEARGLYRELLSRAWSQGGKLPTDVSLLKRMSAATDEEWDRSWPSVSSYWVERDGVLVNETQLEVMSECVRRQQVRTDKARNAARARWDGYSSNAQAVPTECPSNATKEQDQDKSKEPSPEKKSKTTSSPVSEKWQEPIKACFALYRELNPDVPFSREEMGKYARKMQALLRGGITPDQLQDSVRGLASDSFHQERGFVGIKYALVDSDKVRSMALKSNGTARKKAEAARLCACGRSLGREDFKQCYVCQQGGE